MPVISVRTATLLLLCMVAIPGLCAAPPPAPEDIRVRVIGTANFQGRQTALIQDTNTRTDSFYRVGDPLYGYRITDIGTEGIRLEKQGRKFFVEFKAAAVREKTTGESRELVVASSYMPSQAIAPPAASGPARSVVPNFYADGPRNTKWDVWTAPPATPSKTIAAPAREAGGRFVMPVRYRRVSSRFGYRKHPIGGGTRMHKGIDLAARSGTKIYAADSGTVRFSGWRGGYGYCLEVDHHNGFVTVYGHCRKLVADVGDNVRRGDLIAEVGSTGASTGPHLHFEVRKNGTPVNPSQYFRGAL